MLTFHPTYWSIIALVLAIVRPATSHPIRTSNWVRTTQFEDRDNRGIWKVFEKQDNTILPKLALARPSQVNGIRFAT